MDDATVEKRRYYSIHGNDTDGWTLAVYRVEPQGHVTNESREPLQFPKLKDLLETVVENGDIET